MSRLSLARRSASNTTCRSVFSVLKKFVSCLRTWHLWESEAQSGYQKAFITEMTSSNAIGSGTEETWQKLKSSLLKAAENVCGSTKKHWWQKNTWWWNAAVDSAVKEKWRCWKIWRKVASKRNIRRPSASPNMLIWQNPRLNKFSRTLQPAALTFLPRQPNQARKPGCPRWETCLQWCYDTGELCLDDRAKQAAWKEHYYERLSNVEFDWDPDSLTEVYPIEGPPTSHFSWWSRPSSWWNVARLIVAEILWSWRGSANLWSNRGYHPFQEDPYWMGGEYHCLLLQGQGRHPWGRKLSRPQIARAGHEGSREGGWELSMTTNVHWWQAV